MAEMIRHDEIELNKALDMQDMASRGYTHIWYQEQGRVGICRLEEYQPCAPQYLIEARIFANVGTNEDASEVHVFYGQDGRQKADVTTTSGAAPHREERQILLPIYGKSMTLRTVYDYDEDGQALPVATLLTGYEEA